MAELTDIHSHLIYGIYNGTHSLDQSLGAIRMEYSMGMRHQFCTPLIKSREDLALADDINRRMDTVRDNCRKEFPDLQLYLGFVVRPSFDVAGALKGGADLSMAGTGYVLISPEKDAKDDLTRLFGDLLDAGYIPVLAHPECSDQFRSRPQTLEGYLNMGVLLQVNIPSLMGEYGSEVKDFADHLISLRWASFVATDNKRKHFESRLFTGYQYLVAHWRKSKADLLLVENGLKLIRNEVMDNSAAYPWEPAKPSLLGRLFHRN